jgi:methionyl-tRNA formyltransferase
LRAEPAALPDDAAGVPGEVVAIEKGKGIIVKTGSGALAITHLQLEGKRALDADAFLRGHRISVGEVFR